jgi:Ras family protein A
VGCKKDLRYDPKTIEELHKTSQKPVTPEQVGLSISFGAVV